MQYWEKRYTSDANSVYWQCLVNRLFNNFLFLLLIPCMAYGYQIWDIAAKLLCLSYLHCVGWYSPLKVRRILWRPFSINTLRQRQDDHHFSDDIFKCIFLNENISISIKISLKFVPKCPTNNIPSLVQVMAWRWPGNKPWFELMMISLLMHILMHICITRPQWVKTLSCQNRDSH